MTYDSDNIFAKILRGEIPCDKVFENDHALAFNDIAPQAPVHILVIPKGEYISIADFSTKASAEELKGFHDAVGEIIEAQQLEQDGFRVIANSGDHGGQEVPHYHLHILAGEPMGPMRAR